MPFNREKIINIKDFLEQVHKRLEAEGDSNALILFEIFLQNELVEALKATGKTIPNWDGSVNAGDFDAIYPFSVEILHDAASRNFSEHSDTYKDAHAVSTAFWVMVNEIFECSGEEVFDLIPIKSFVDMAVEADVVTVEDGLVHLTPRGEEIAQNVEREIKGPQN